MTFSQFVLFPIYSFLNLFFSQSILFSINSFLNQFFSQSILFRVATLCNIPRTEKYSIAMRQM